IFYVLSFKLDHGNIRQCNYNFLIDGGLKMTNKEWLKNITPKDLDLNGNVLLMLDGSVLMMFEDYYWLIKQAKLVQELEKQNKRYREALEFYANEETYEMKFVANTDEICVPLTVIELDEGKKARQALEGDE